MRYALILSLVLSACGYDSDECHIENTKVVCANGTLDTAGNNGQDGKDGLDGLDGVDGAPGRDAILEVIDPCGPHDGVDEVLLVLNDGSILAWYKNVGLTILECGKAYRTTDRQRCAFALTDDCEYIEAVEPNERD